MPETVSGADDVAGFSLEHAPKKATRRTTSAVAAREVLRFGLKVSLAMARGKEEAGYSRLSLIESPPENWW